jgi:hypothetical protein
MGSESGVEELADEDSSGNENKGSCEEAEATTANSVIANPRTKDFGTTCSKQGGKSKRAFEFWEEEILC